MSVDLSLDQGTRLAGAVGGYFPGKGLMAYHGGRFKGNHLLQLWLDHLALSAGDLWHRGEASRLLTTDKSWRIAPLAPERARAMLEDYCALYREGRNRPLPILPEISYLWANARNPDEALARASRRWHDAWSGNRYGDRHDAYVQLVQRRQPAAPFNDPLFDLYARRLYAGVLGVAEPI